MKSQTSAINAESKAAVAIRLSDPRFELVPIKNASAQGGFLPAGAAVSVTASPKGLDATIDLSEQLVERGFRVIPHLGARMVRDERHLRQLIARLRDLGIERAFVVGGDSTEAGEYFDALSLLRAMAHLGHHFKDIGVGCYPDGHAFIQDDRLLEALHDKQPFAHYMTTQMCFDPETITRWIGIVRNRGITLPVFLGVPGAVELRKLIQISVRIGVGNSSRFLAKNPALMGKLVKPGAYNPTGLLESLAPTMLANGADISGFHIYTFNQVETTERWRVEMLERMAAVDS